MKLRISILLALALACATLTAQCSRQNHVQNAGFEAGLANWNWALSGGAAATCSVDSTQRHWGRILFGLRTTADIAAEYLDALPRELLV